MRGFSRRAGLRIIASRGTSIRYCFSGRKLHERDRLKHVGGLGEEQTAKVVKNGEGGTKRVWKPATRNRVFRESSPRPPLSGSGRHAGNPLHAIGRCELRFEPDGEAEHPFQDTRRCELRFEPDSEAEQLDGLGTLTSRPVRRVVGVPTERESASAGSWEVRHRQQIKSAPGRMDRPLQCVVGLRRDLRIVAGCERQADLTNRRGLRITFGESGWSVGRTIAFGRWGNLPTFVRGDGFGLIRWRVQRGWNDHLGRGEQPHFITGGLYPGERPLDPGTRPWQSNNDTDPSAVGQGASWTGHRSGRNVTFGWRARSNRVRLRP